MALNRKDWQAFATFREIHGSVDAKVRWSLTTACLDDRGRRRQFAAKHCGNYPGGLAEPFLFDDLASLKRFILEPLNSEAKAFLKKQERKNTAVVSITAKPVRRARFKSKKKAA